MAVEAGVDPLLLPPPPLAPSCVRPSQRASSIQVGVWALDDLDHLLLCDTVVSHRRRHCNILLRI